MTASVSKADFLAAADYIRSRLGQRMPTVGLILGSGLGGLADAVEDPIIIPYQDIPHWPQSSVLGHKNRLVIGHLAGQQVLVQQGRAHFYEGHPMAIVTFPVRVMQMLGISTLIVTNAAGGINKSFAAGDVMLLQDHINFVGLSGNNPLVGPNDDSLGPRFPDMTTTYDKKLRAIARQVASEQGFTLQEGVYCFLSGPTFESPAEIRLLRQWGADAVGMSTVPEVVIARHAGMRILGLSGISNLTNDNPETGTELTHQEVLDNIGTQCAPKMMAVIKAVLKSLA